MERRLAAILAADVIGYSKMMASDEEATLALLKQHRQDVFDPAVTRHNGRIIKLIGDGTLVEFASAVDAVNCAVAIQEALTANSSPLQLRIGINLGDVMVDGDDIYGDGVNIAARLEAMARPGGVCISDLVYQSIRAKTGLSFKDLGQQSLKNIDQPVRAWQWPEGEHDDAETTGNPMPALPDKPSIAVLPFDNMSGDPEQEYFADGIVEDIITALSRMKGLFVIARNSSFTYKGKAVDIKQVGHELGVRYVLEGSVRKAANRIRITGQLIDASNGTHLWADRFDGQIEDVFDLQDHVTQSVVAAIAPKLEQAEIDRSRSKPTHSLDAYDYFLRGMAAFHQFTREANSEAIDMFAKACERDPGYGAAYAMQARSYAQRKGFGWTVDYEGESAKALDLALQGADVGRDDAVALAAAGFALVMFGDPADGDALLDRALQLNPNLAWVWHMSGFSKALSGHAEFTVERAAMAMRLSPQDPQMFAMQNTTAIGHFLMGKYEDALHWSQAALRDKPNFLFAAGVIAASNAMLGKTENAASSLQRLRDMKPDLRISNLGGWVAFKRREDFEVWADGLRKAGLPE